MEFSIIIIIISQRTYLKFSFLIRAIIMGATHTEGRVKT
jgi:hypothetical protein